MLRITHTSIYDLNESVIACRNAMRVAPPKYTEEEFQESLKRAVKLAKAGGGSGHSNFRKGIRVSFDIVYPQYISLELQRYGFVDIIASSSKMHSLAKMDMRLCTNRYVTKETIENMQRYIDVYNENPIYDNFMRMLANCPMGLELFMRCSTNYEQLATIYRQRKNHKLREWHTFCEWIEGLPYAKELIICEEDGDNNL